MYSPIYDVKIGKTDYSLPAAFNLIVKRVRDEDDCQEEFTEKWSALLSKVGEH
jgi:hypothetical protein